MAPGNDPFADLLTLQRDIDRVMTTFGRPSRSPDGDGQSLWTPAADVFRRDGGIVVRLELPGVDPSAISVSVTGNMLTIRGERRKDERIADPDFVLRETTYGSFERRITLPQEVDAGQVRAQYRSGILEVTVPRSALVPPAQTRVQVSGARPSMGAQEGYPQGTPEGYPQGAPQAAPQDMQQGGQPGAQQAWQQPGQQGGQQGFTQGAGQGSQASGGTAQGRTQGETGQLPGVQVQGGWVVPQQSQEPHSQASEQQMGASYRAEQYGMQGQEGTQSPGQPHQPPVASSQTDQQAQRPDQQTQQPERPKRSRFWRGGNH